MFWSLGGSQNYSQGGQNFSPQGPNLLPWGSKTTPLGPKLFPWAKTTSRGQNYYLGAKTTPLGAKTTPLRSQNYSTRGATLWEWRVAVHFDIYLFTEIALWWLRWKEVIWDTLQQTVPIQTYGFVGSKWGNCRVQMWWVPNGALYPSQQWPWSGLNNWSATKYFVSLCKTQPGDSLNWSSKYFGPLCKSMKKKVYISDLHVLVWLFLEK